MARAKILVTYGPACQSRRQLEELVERGASAVRYNFSHGNPEDFRKVVAMVRQISKRLNQPIAVLADLQGPKIRCGDLPPEGLNLEAGERVLISARQPERTVKWIPFASARVLKTVQPGHQVLFDDGQMVAVAERLVNEGLWLKIQNGGVLYSKKGINFPDSTLALSCLTPKDRSDAQAALRYGADYLALSFVQHEDDVMVLRRLTERAGRADIPIIAKIEKPQAVRRLREILQVVSGVMIARGDLGVEMPLEEVPAIQKTIIGQANHSGKLVITATQMLDSMIRLPRPTRAEASDVVNAIIDGTDVVMLSGETASGKYAAEAVSVMKRLIVEAEDFAKLRGIEDANAFVGGSEIRATICQAAVQSTRSMPVAAIFVHTHSGKIGRYVSKFRPQVPIFSLTPSLGVSQRCSLFWGTTPYAIPKIKSTSELVAFIGKITLRLGLKDKKVVVAIISGFPFSPHVSTNMFKLHEVTTR